MSKFTRIIFLLFLIVSFVTLSHAAVPTADFYQGDTSVYYGSSDGAPPNIMFLIDSSQQMDQFGAAAPYRNLNCTYSKNENNEDVIICSTTNTQFYSGTQDVTSVYQWKKDHFEKQNNPSLAQIESGCPDAYKILNERGIWSGHQTVNGFQPGCLQSNGTCCTNQSHTFATGDYVRWSSYVGVKEQWVDKTYAWGDVVFQSSEAVGIEYRCVNTSGCSTNPFEWINPEGLDEGVEWVSGDEYAMSDIVYKADGDLKIRYECANESGCTSDPFNPEWQTQVSLMELVAETLIDDIFPLLIGHIGRPNIGLAHYGGTQGGHVVLPTMAHETTDLLVETLVSEIVPAPGEKNANSQQPASALWDAGLYFSGDIGESNLTLFNQNDANALGGSPIEYWCQGNHIILIVSGTKKENLSSTGLPDVGDDGHFDDVAHYLYNNFPLQVGSYSSKVRTHVIQLMTAKDDALEKAALEGGGEYIHVESTADVVPALLRILTGVLSETSSFVAPVVPANPDNRAYSGDKIYLGFFKPKFDEPWCGNLKKFKLGPDSLIYGFSSTTGTDDQCEDENFENCNLIPATDEDGFFVHDGTQQKTPTVRSYWSTVMDGGEVELGGAGQRLIEVADVSRVVYTNISTALISFSKNTEELNHERFNLSNSTERDLLIDFIRGVDSSGNKRPWILADIIHSKPVVVPYENGGEIKPYVFVGSNGGMLHAFDDSNGNEEWSFIPNDLLKSLKYLMDFDYQTFYVDSPPVVYHNDVNNDGIVNNGEKVILISGMRRGGGLSSIPAPEVPLGSYFALDISDPTTKPELLWTLNSISDNATEMGQTWSVPVLTTVRSGSSSKIVAIIGAGYDTNEDMRYGNTQNFPVINAATITSEAYNGADIQLENGDHEPVTSIDSVNGNPYNPRGRGVLVIDAEDGEILKRAIFSSSKYPFPSDPLVLDSDMDGYSDRIYIGNTGGQLWRFDIGDVVGNLDLPFQLIFESNVDAIEGQPNDVGRKIFYPPTATIMGDDVFVYFGTGDREHPLNTAVVDRFYVVRDRANEANPPWPLSEGDLVDLTDNDLQDNPDKALELNTLTKLQSPYTVEEKTFYGWYIEFDQNKGEKVLALPKVLNGILFFTTYAPATINKFANNYDPCEGVLGDARLYALNARTGQAVFNLSGEKSSIEIDGEMVETLLRKDRSIVVGKGIASEPLIIVDKSGNLSVMVGAGGGFFNSGTLTTIDPLFPVYWMTW